MDTRDTQFLSPYINANTHPGGADSLQPRVAHLRRLAFLLDDAFEIPILRWRIGWDGLIGLIPGFGDMAGFAVSLYFVFVSAQLGVSTWVLMRMLLNVTADAVLGSIPFIGDLIDFALKANRKNLQLLEQSLAGPRKAKWASIGFLMIFFAFILGFALLVGWGVLQLGHFIMQSFGPNTQTGTWV
jgi:hypothetical protein